MTPTPTHIKQRVSDLLAQMTSMEKIRQLGGYWFYELQTKGQLDLEKSQGEAERWGGADHTHCRRGQSDAFGGCQSL